MNFYLKWIHINPVPHFTSWNEEITGPNVLRDVTSQLFRLLQDCSYCWREHITQDTFYNMTAGSWKFRDECVGLMQYYGNICQGSDIQVLLWANISPTI